jgi:hypothetical protein
VALIKLEKKNYVGNQKSNEIQIIKQNELDAMHAVLYLSVNNQDCMDNNRHFFLSLRLTWITRFSKHSSCGSNFQKHKK